MQIATGSWYEANLVPMTRDLDMNEIGRPAMAFDGLHLWVATGPNLRQFRVHDGALVGIWCLVGSSNYDPTVPGEYVQVQQGVCDADTGSEISGIATDGMNVWVGTEDGFLARLGSTPPYLTAEISAHPFINPGYPGMTALAFDGALLWYAGLGHNNEPTIGYVDALTLDGGYSASVADLPQQMLFDGTYLWALSSLEVSAFTTDYVDGSASSPVATFSFADAGAMTFDGQNVWVAHLDSTDVWLTPIDASSLTIGPALSAGRSPDPPIGVSFDGEALWMIRTYADDEVVLSQYDASNGALVGHYGVAEVDRCDWRAHPSNPDIEECGAAIAFDGQRVWIAYQGAGLDPPGSYLRRF